MSAKWINISVKPLRQGSYITRWHNHFSGSPFYYKRVDFYPMMGIFIDSGGNRYDPKKDYESVTFEWWDEYNSTEEKIVKKLNFKPKPK